MYFGHQSMTGNNKLHEMSKLLCDENILIIRESVTVLLVNTEDSFLLLAAQIMQL